MAGELQVFATNDDDLGSAQDLLGDDRCEATQKVTATVDDDCLKLQEWRRLEDISMFKGYVRHKQMAFRIIATRWSHGVVRTTKN